MRGRWICGLITCAVGCGRLNFDPLGATDSGSATDDGACVLGPWSAPVRQVALGSPQTDWGPGLSPDGLEIIFASDRGGNLDLYYSSRASIADPFDPATHMNQSTAAQEGSPTFTGDGMTVYYNNLSVGPLKMQRASRSDPFGAAVACPELSSLNDSTGLSFTADGQELFHGGAIMDHAVSNGTSYVEAGTLNELGPGGYASISGDGLTIYFTTDRNAPLQLFRAVRPDRGSPFAAPEIADDVLGGGDGDDVSISADDRSIVYRSTRIAGDNGEIYALTRSCQ